MPENLKNEIGHFNIFKLEPFIPGVPVSIPYKRRDYYKIMLVMGNSQVHFADKVLEIEKQALSFSCPQIPYKWEHLDNVRSGVYCVFNSHFFSQFGNIQQYAVFQPNGEHVFELTDEHAGQIENIFQRMFMEINSEYMHKYDVLRTLVFELIHFALKLHPSVKVEKQPLHASQRVATLFMELLERQFPIDDTHQSITLRSASDFASRLNIHANYLNRAVKEITEKTTTQIIAERIMQEAKVLLKQSTWSVSEIGYALGFTEATHFINFFTKHMQVSPLKFRNV
jgi:AraC-like DNA-binding protein